MLIESWAFINLPLATDPSIRVLRNSDLNCKLVCHSNLIRELDASIECDKQTIREQFGDPMQGVPDL